MNDIDWYIVQRMLIDSPKYDSKKDDEDSDSKDTKKKKNTTINLTDLDAEEQINKIFQ